MTIPSGPTSSQFGKVRNTRHVINSGPKPAIPDEKPPLRSMTQKRKLVVDSRKLYLSVYPHVDTTGACLYHAVALQLLAFKRHGERFMLQAGTAFWERTPDEYDEARFYGYAWEAGKKRVKHYALAPDGSGLLEIMPEVHVWLAHHDPDTLIDPTTGQWPARAKKDGLDWPGVKPPEFLWETSDKFLRRDPEARYLASIEAAEFVDELASKELYPKLIAKLGLTRSVGEVPR